MNKKENLNQSINDLLIIEDFKRACIRIEHHESRILRIYILILSGFVIILGITPNLDYLRIKPFYIPLILGIFLWSAYNIAIADRRLKFFAMSYLLIVSKTYKGVNYQDYINDFMFNEKYVKSRLWVKLQSIFRPFLLMYLFGLFYSINLVYPILKNWYQNCDFIPLVVYSAVLLLIHGLIIGKLYILYKDNFKKIKTSVISIHEKHN